MRESARAFSQHMRPKKTALHLEDLLIVLNFVNANESFKESECAALACRARALMLGLRATRALRRISAYALPRALLRCCSCLAVQPPAGVSQVLDADLHAQALRRRQRLRIHLLHPTAALPRARKQPAHERNQPERAAARCTRRLHAPARVRERDDRRSSNFWCVALRARGTLRAVSGCDRRYA
jgi:hypothetical protein